MTTPLKVSTTRFGDIEVTAEDHLVEFRDGMIGFSQLKRYILVESPTIPLILWLQSVENPDVAFPVMEPYFFKRPYQAPLTDADRHALGQKDGDRLKLFVVLTIPEDMTQMTANLKAPVLINLERGTGAQVILQDKSLEVRTPAFAQFDTAISQLGYVHQSAEVEDVAKSWSPVEFKRTSVAAEL